jgi:hypothetical protein
VAGTSTPAGASPSRSVWHRQDRVGRIVEFIVTCQALGLGPVAYQPLLPLKVLWLIVISNFGKPLQIVHVHQVPMKTTLKNVHHVLIHVPPVLLMKVVKPVKKTESTHQPVTVKMDTMLLNTNVTYVLTDVSLVNLTNGTVPIVPKTELKNHIAVAQPVTSIMVWKILSVIHVLHNVSPVLVLLTIVIPVPETESVQMNVHVQWLP